MAQDVEQYLSLTDTVLQNIEFSDKLGLDKSK